jgi:Ulp1 family protease
LKLIKSYAPKLPKQENYIDCGIFMLYFCEKFLSDVEFFFSNAKQEFVDSNVNNNDSLLKWFDVNEIKQKRNNIMNLLVNIGTDNKDSSIVIENYIKSLNNKT